MSLSDVSFKVPEIQVCVSESVCNELPALAVSASSTQLSSPLVKPSLSTDVQLLSTAIHGSVPLVWVGSNSRGKQGPTDSSLVYPPRYGEADGGHGWLVLVASFFAYFINGGALSTHGILLPYFIQGFDADTVIITMLPSVQFGLCLTSGLFAGPLVETHGCRLVCMVGSSLAALGYVISSFITNIWLFFVTYSILPGIGLGLQYIPAAIIVQEWFDKKRSVATGVQSSGSGVGSILFPLITRALLDAYGWRGSMLILGALIAHSVAFAIVFAPGPLNLINTEDNSEEEEKRGDPSEAKRKSILKDLIMSFRELITDLFDFSVLKEIPCLVVLIGAFLFSIGYQVPYIFLPAKSISLGISSFHTALFISIFGVSDVIGRLNAGWIGNLSFVNRLQVFSFGMALSGVSALVSAFFFSYGLLLSHAATFGCGVGVYQVMQAPCLVDLLGMERLARAYGLLQVASGIAFLISPPLGALTYKYTGNINIPFIIGGVSMIAAGVFVFAYDCIAKPMEREEEKEAEKEAPSDGAEAGSLVDSMGHLNRLRNMERTLISPTSPFFTADLLERGVLSTQHLASSRQFGSRRLFQSVRGLEGVRQDRAPRDAKAGSRAPSRAYLPGAFGSTISINSRKYFSSVVFDDSLSSHNVNKAHRRKPDRS